MTSSPEDDPILPSEPGDGAPQPDDPDLPLEAPDYDAIDREVAAGA
ncbi:hypothetical protein [Acrocarpospora sp. B8E8]